MITAFLPKIRCVDVRKGKTYGQVSLSGSGCNKFLAFLDMAEKTVWIHPGSGLGKTKHKLRWSQTSTQW